MGTGMLLIACVLAVQQLEAMLIKRYGEKHGEGGMVFNGIICLFAMVYFFITDQGGLHFPGKIWGYGLLNSLMYAVGFYSTYVAIKSGSFALTRLFISFSVMIPTFYGILILNESASTMTYVALGMILVSLFLMHYQKGEGNGQKVTSKWVLNVVLAVLANAALVIIGRVQFGAFGDTYKNEFLILSLGGAAVVLFALGILMERNSFKATIRYGLLYGAGAGVFNGINNLLTLVTYNYLPLSVSSPIKSGLGIVFSFSLSLFLYKEKFSKTQFLSVMIGILAVVLMNL
ncbi:MAG: hypothetical protein IJE10_10945 [Clostridia bacterium]|nr:hypothetical protein [Clostridia bacterium]